MNKSLLSILLASMASTAIGAMPDYTKGIIFVNEDWYGHQNSTLNYLLPDDPEGNYWQYRIFQAENEGHELGCTNQFGAIWHNRLYLIAKQEKDPGASITGGRITVADATTLKMLHQQPEIDPSGAQCDGRAFCGIDEHKGYVSTSNGIWVFDLDNYKITGQVKGSANPNAGGDNDKPNTDPTGSLYHGQSGTMILAEGKVFAAHQQYGLLVINPQTDEVTDIIPMTVVAEKAGIGGIVRSKDGMIWASVAKNTQGTGTTLPNLVRIDPATLEYKIFNVPDDMYPPSNSWYAWTPDAFAASRIQNAIYWKGGPNRWFTGTKIYKYDIDNDKYSLFTDLDEEGADWKLYGCSLGVDPLNDDVYMSLYHEFGKRAYITRRYNASGEIIKDYEMIENYWFPSIPIFAYAENISGVENLPSEPDACGFNAGLTGDNIIVYSAMGIIEVYDINGHRISRKEAEPSGATLLERPGQHGIYIVRNGAYAKKIVL